MLNFLKKENNFTYTENGALTHQSTNSECLDLFATIGAIRFADDSDVVARFIRAYCEDADLAMKILFFGRDVRGGLGERKVFRTIIRYLADTNPASVVKNIPYIAEFGRFDDLLCLFGTSCQDEALKAIKTQLDADLDALTNNKEISLLGKWLPSVNASSRDTVAMAKTIARYLNLSDADYRRLLTKLRSEIRIIENNLRCKDYSFDYEKQPSKAMLKYRKAFMRNDGERYGMFMNKVSSGEAVLKTGALAPYDIVRSLIDYNRWCFKTLDENERKAIGTTWNSLEDFTNGENALVVVDGSGSMYSGTNNPKPIEVAVSLGIYFAERNKGAFKNHFITFSHTPRLVEIKGKDICDKVQYCMSYNEVANTNLQNVFSLILNTAVKNHLPQEQLPAKLYIISDMEFDHCVADAGVTNFEWAKREFAKHGYTLPQVIFWNVDSRNNQQPVTQHENGVALVSGASPRIFKMLTSDNLNPYTFMMEVIGSERYAKIAA
ncbi:MAG: DUF2828 family protein [Oscillospiraceae bacterium]|nr:DUF2828 family protein [Oscillospiraceae bacterium]